MSRKFWRILFLILLSLSLVSCTTANPHWKPVDSLWIVDGFDFPVGDANGKGWDITGYRFLDWSKTSGSFHPGEDWNIPGVGNADQGEPVYAIAHGKVVYSGWNSALGNIILVKHYLSAHDFVWSQYAHLDARLVETGDIVGRRQKIGTVGRGPNNRFTAHLHFELRKVDLPANAWPRTNGQAWEKDNVLDYWLNPSQFIKQNRPR